MSIFLMLLMLLEHRENCVFLEDITDFKFWSWCKAGYRQTIFFNGNFFFDKSPCSKLSTPIFKQVDLRRKTLAIFFIHKRENKTCYDVKIYAEKLTRLTALYYFVARSTFVNSIKTLQNKKLYITYIRGKRNMRLCG